MIINVKHRFVERLSLQSEACLRAMLGLRPTFLAAQIEVMPDYGLLWNPVVAMATNHGFSFAFKLNSSYIETPLLLLDVINLHIESIAIEEIGFLSLWRYDNSTSVSTISIFEDITLPRQMERWPDLVEFEEAAESDAGLLFDLGDHGAVSVEPALNVSQCVCVRSWRHSGEYEAMSRFRHRIQIH